MLSLIYDIQSYTVKRRYNKVSWMISGNTMKQHRTPRIAVFLSRVHEIHKAVSDKRRRIHGVHFMPLPSDIEALAPFGNGNPRPLLTTSGVTLAEAPKRMGGGERHLSAKIQQHGVTLRAVAFGQGDRVDELQQCGDSLEIAYRPVVNHWRGRSTVELHLVDWRPVQQPATTLARGS